jgi:hypothetical protein
MFNYMLEHQQHYLHQQDERQEQQELPAHGEAHLTGLACAWCNARLEGHNAIVGSTKYNVQVFIIIPEAW